MPLTQPQRWLAAQWLVDTARDHGVMIYRERHRDRVVIEWPDALDPSLKAQFEAEFLKLADEVKELLRP